MTSLTGFPDHKLPPDTLKLVNRIFEIAKEYGLTSHPIKFVLVSPKELNSIAAYDGFPSRMPHWTYGMAFEDIHKRYTYGQSKIYELVINTDPVIAYLLSTNTPVEQKLVMMHVCAHADFFYNNVWFENTNLQMIDQTANNASRVRRIISLHGDNKVEDFFDTCMSLENLIDPYLTHIKRKGPARDKDADITKIPIPKLKSNEYMDRFINTQDFIDLQKKKIEEERQKAKHFPEDPDRDILEFLVEHAPLERWQRDILSMLREESYYFAPQRMTKIMNEGWATYVHSKFMTTKLAMDSEIIDYCDSQSRAIATNGQSINPYRLGLQLYKDIEERWDKGRFGREWERCEDLVQKHQWDKKLGLGKEKLFQIRKTHNDLTFIDDFLTPEFCVENKLFSFKVNEFNHVDINREFRKIKEHLLKMLANGGSPVIQITDANFENRGELKLQHVADGQELDPKKGRDTLQNLYKIWTRPVHLETIQIDNNGEKGVVWVYDGKTHSTTLLNGDPVPEPAPTPQPQLP